MKRIMTIARNERIQSAVSLFTPIVLFVALNGLALLVASLAGTPRGFLINVDFTLPALLLAAPFTGRASLHTRIAVCLALFALCAVDLAAFSTRFYVTADAIANMAGFISLWPWKLLLPVASILAVFSIATAWAVPMPVRPAGAIALIVLLAVASLLDVASGRNRFFQTGDAILPNVAASAILTMAQPLYHSATSPQLAPTPLTESLAAELPLPAPKRILSVSVESFGVLSDPTAQATTVAPLIDGLGGRYRVRVMGAREYRGGTLSGEIRELCALRTLSLIREDTTFTALQNCLPHRLAKSGYETIAVHGNDGAFYARSRVYPGMGFQRAVFKKELVAAGARKCSQYIFEGACDRDVFQWSLGLFRADTPQFVHVMTLDSHFPLPVRDTGCLAGKTRGERSLCVYRWHIRRVMGDLATSIADAKIPPDLIIVYGDHMPPFNEPSRGKFRASSIPYMELERIRD
jgi:phosphoglycerol transferase MdoB-like AlkP superfamily enzyme